jgi:hypothetical protein
MLRLRIRGLMLRDLLGWERGEQHVPIWMNGLDWTTVHIQMLGRQTWSCSCVG